MEMKNSFYNLAVKIDGILSRDNPSTDWTQLQQLLKNRDIELYFFRNVKSPNWFALLKEKGYFKAENNPMPIPAEKSSYFTIPNWYVLDYLEKISQQIFTDQVDQYSEHLLDIIRNVTKYYVENNRKFDNYHTWGYFVRILLNIPNEKIHSYLQQKEINIANEWLKEWITSKFDNLVPASDIATKLLPKFLTDKKEDTEIAEQIIDVITNIKENFFEDEETVQGIVLFEKKKEPKTKVDSYWLIESFQKNATQIGKLCSDRIIFSLAGKLKKILDKEHSDHQVLIELESDIIYRISAKRIKEFEFKISIEKLHHEEIVSLKPEDRYFGVLKVKGDVTEGFPFVIDECRNENTFIEKIKSKEFFKSNRLIFLTQGIDTDKKLTNLYRGLYSDYSSIWYKSLSIGPDVGIHNAQELLIFILRDILLSKCSSDVSTGKLILDKFLSDEYQYPLFRRFVLLVAGTHWNEYKDLFWKFIEVAPEPFDESDYEVELFKLLQQNVLQFKSEEKEKVMALISKGPRWIPDQKQEYYVAYWKQKWLAPMQKDPYFAKLFNEQKAITEVEKIEPPSEEAVMTRWGEGPSPLKKEDILKMPNNQALADYLNDFRTKDRWDGPTAEGLAEVLKIAVKENPKRFVDELTPFLKLNCPHKYNYIHNILRGLEDAWKEKKDFDWGKLFSFVKIYIENPDFWKEAEKAQGEDWARGTHTWVINVVSDLIQEGTRDDSWAFSESYFEQAKEILGIAIEKLPVRKEDSYEEAVTRALNTSFGRVIIALILLSLRIARANDKKGIKEIVRWREDQYDDLFKKEVIEAFTLFGQYMPNFAYLNKPWVEQKIKDFESLDDIQWQSFIEGYLFGGRVYQDLYKLMRNHYLKAIGTDFKEGHTEDRLIQHISIGYIRGVESLDDNESLFKKVIDKLKYSHLQEIVNFFWSQSDHIVKQAKEIKEAEEDKKVKDKIIKFWQWAYENRDMIKERLKDDYKKLLSDLSRLIVFLENIDSENSKWLLLSAPYIDVNFNDSLFIEYLDKHEGKESIGFISEIYLKMLTTTTPTYDQKNIISIIEKIYLLGNKKEADEICNIYGSRGFEFLRPIYEINNK